MSSDKRRYKRVSAELPVTVYLYNNKSKARLGYPIAGRIKNFSPVGAALTLVSILLDGQHLFYTCLDNPDIVLELAFEIDDSPEKIITIPATPVWFDRDLDSETKKFIVGVNFLASANSREIKTLCKEVCRDEMMLVTLWKKLF